ncbi:MAG: DeoR/GlpR family DNA-binding transcription regulator [Sphaerochaetaceae bacterium]|nr:DeoR/GlpR family DNA-binding transcription regulator [Sphaerochaetaceae bacterium]
MNRRQEQELQLLKENHFLSVKQLSEKMQVSEMTIRRDIQYLDKKKLAKQVFGGIKTVPIIANYDRDLELTINREQKIKIAKFAAKLVKDGDIVFFDTGTTVELIAEYLDKDLECTFITFSLPVINKLQKLKKSTLIVCGGKYSQKSNSFISNEQALEIDKYRANKAFIGITGFDYELGVTCSYIDEKSLKHALVTNSKEAIIVTDSSKFGNVSTCIFGRADEFDKVITDANIPNEYKLFLENLGVEIIIIT